MNLACAFTLLNMCCGFAAIILHQLGYDVVGLALLLAAFVCDGLDGYLARSRNESSAFGERLDSLSDLLSFGVAPVFFCLNVTSASAVVLTGVLLLYLCCGATRLARYDPKIQKDMFKGMPIPMAGLLLTSLCITSDSVGWFNLAPALIGLLMISSIPFIKVKFTRDKLWVPGLMFGGFATTLLITHELAVAVLAFTVPYLVVNLVLASLHTVQGMLRAQAR